MIIILEGADNAGKSTLGTRLANDTGLELVHPGGPPKTVSDAVLRCVEQSAAFNRAASFNFIYDRVTCISDMIYRGNQMYRLGYEAYQNELMVCKDVLIVYCRPCDAQLMNFDNHVTKSHETDEVVEHAKQNVGRIIAEYDDVMNRLILTGTVPVWSYDFKSDTESAAYRAILGQINAGLNQYKELG